MTDLRPFWSYFGGKWTLAPRYPAPEHAVVVEPFAGSAGYATRHHGREVILVEKSPTIAALWRWLISVSVDEVLSLPLDPRRADHLAPAPHSLIRFWCARGRTTPPRSTSSWMTAGAWPTSFWGEYVRTRIARQVQEIRHWRVIEGDYTDAPDVEATWFIDPPYAGSRHYVARVRDYSALAKWVRRRRGLAVACEQGGADWLPFLPFREAKSLTHRPYREVVYVQRSARRVSA